MSQKILIICFSFFNLLLGTQLLAFETSNMKKNIETKESFDLAMVEELALFYAEESVRNITVPLTLRVVEALNGEKVSKEDQINNIRSNPPKVNEKVVVFPFGKNNPLSFVYNPDNRTMTVWERFIKKRGAIGFYGLTSEELAVEINKTTSRKKDRASADFAYDKITDSLSLKRVYRFPPKNRKKFYKEIDKILKIRMKWMRKERFLKTAKAAANRNKPPESAASENKGFHAVLVLRHFSVPPELTQFYTGRYVKTWDRVHGIRPPLLVSDKTFQVGQLLNAFVHFQGASNGENGKGKVELEIKLIGPNGEVVFEKQKIKIWQNEAPPIKHLQIGENNLSISMDKESTIGQYLILANVCDQMTNRCVEIKHPIELLKNH